MTEIRSNPESVTYAVFEELRRDRDYWRAKYKQLHRQLQSEELTASLKRREQRRNRVQNNDLLATVFSQTGKD